MKWILLAVGLALPVAAVAQEDCYAKVGDPAINQCLGVKLEKANAKVRSEYELILKRIAQSDRSSEAKKELKEGFAKAQSNWEAFSKADCDALYSFRFPGMDRKSASIECGIKHDKRRLSDFAEFEKSL